MISAMVCFWSKLYIPRLIHAGVVILKMPPPPRADRFVKLDTPLTYLQSCEHFFLRQLIAVGMKVSKVKRRSIDKVTCLDGTRINTARFIFDCPCVNIGLSRLTFSRRTNKYFLPNDSSRSSWIPWPNSHLGFGILGVPVYEVGRQSCASAGSDSLLQRCRLGPYPLSVGIDPTAKESIKRDSVDLLSPFLSMVRLLSPCLARFPPNCSIFAMHYPAPVSAGPPDPQGHPAPLVHREAWRRFLEVPSAI
ncbi:hypothetical protein BS47DRAFT_494645 [Hydnum rufescens UP504]|uniref:Uncharacterized protein n=1 Tax=Hydnum rufescens UP504 TaxID=1448309 RepID=A0A9P6DJZ0_9AGAM|nr:hypothetical protein BS47DRAFT_494645 [Hydnum rufescens UP504]